MECCVCFEETNRVLEICKHIVCIGCEKRLELCPICQDVIGKMVKFKLHTGGFFDIQINPRMTIFEIKKMFEDVMETPAEQVQFVLGGRVMADDDLFAKYGYGRGIIVHTVLNLRGD